MESRPGYVWSGTEWVRIGGPVVQSPIYYQASAPSSPSTGDIWVESDVNVPTIASSSYYRWRKTMVGGETTLSGTDDNSLTLAYSPNYEMVFLNGVMLTRGVDYTATTGSTVTGLTAFVANDVVEVMSPLAFNIADTYTQSQVYTKSQADAKYVNKTVGGLNLIVPTGATNGTVGANGAITIGSGVSSVAVAGAFSSTYDNYKVIVSGGSAAGDTYINFSLTGGTSVYSYAFTYTAFGTSSALGDQGVNAASMAYGGYGGTNGLDMNIEINSPFLSKWTTFKTPIVTSSLSGVGNGIHKAATSFTGFTLTAQSFAMTGGTIRIYGYNNGA